MIINFNVQNFGSIKDKQTLSFEADNSNQLEDYYIIPITGKLRLLKMALIYGANASGKTILLKALEFLRELVLEPEEKKTDSLNFKPFLFDNATPLQNSILSIEFLQNKIRYYYEVEFNKSAIIREELYFYAPNKANVFKRRTDIEKQYSEITFGSKIKSDKTFEKTLESNTLWNNTVLGGFLKTNIELKELKDVTDWFNDYLRPLISTTSKLNSYVSDKLLNTEGEKSTLINILRKADLNISDIIIKDKGLLPDSTLKIYSAFDISGELLETIKNVPRKQIEFEHTVGNSKYFLPIEDESQGTQRYYGFAGLLSSLINRSIAIPIDEIESSLHPDLFNHFLLSFLVNSKNSQIIATTHNREILNNKDIFRDDVIWFTDKSAASATELYSLSDFDSSVIRDTSNVYNAYKTGKLGGIPHLGDYYIDNNNGQD
jgi:AAA15 family ATPase/GTPase